MKSKLSTAAVTRDGDIYCVSCPGYWGKGETIEAAIQALPYGLDRKSWILYSIHPECYINDGGFWVYPVDHKPIEIDCCASKRATR